MTIHRENPFLDPDPDPVRQLRGRIGGAVSLWTSGSEADRAGLTVSSLMVATGEPGAVLGLLDPDSDLFERLTDTGTAVVHLLRAGDRALADAFGGVAPAPGGPFRLGTWVDSEWGPRLVDADSWAGVRLVETRPTGWAELAICSIDSVTIGPDDDPLVHRRGRYQRG